MNTTNNHPRTSNQVLHETNYEDYYYAQQANADCCVINFICFSCMVIGLYCLFNYDLNVYLNKNSFSNKTNLTGILNPNNKSNIFSVSITNK